MSDEKYPLPERTIKALVVEPMKPCRVQEFPDTLFVVPDGANIDLTQLDGTRSTLPCQYVDDTHI